MHVTAKVGSFRTAFGKVAKLVPAKSPRPILQNVLLDASGDGPPTLLATDLDVGLSYGLPGASVLSPGRCLLPTRIAAALASLPPDEILDIAVHGSHIHLSATGWKSKLNSEDPDLFPTVPGAETGGAFAAVAGADFKRAIGRATYACDEQSTRFALGGCLAERDEGGQNLVLVATDGRRLVKCVVPATIEAIPAADAAASAPVLSRRFLDLVAGLIDPDAELDLRVDSSRAAIAVQSGWSLYGRLVEGRFPAYRAVFPDEVPAVRATVNTAELLAAVNRASIACSEESRGIDCLWSADGLDIVAESSDLGRSDGRVAVDYEGHAPGSGVGATLDNRYLAEMLKSGAPETLRFDVISHKHAIMARGDADGLMVCLMPLSRDR